jgi:Kef-type K+ transport system membrane component KefB
VVSFVLAVAAGLALDAGGLVGSSLLVVIMLAATSLGVVVPVLKDSGEATTTFGQLVIASASIANVATIVLLSLFFSGESAGLGAPPPAPTFASTSRRATAPMSTTMSTAAA